ncbi:MAG: hypothetical protein L0219_20080 [Phycisphaerales bacterium]|nr:hypothetical protein [Phycisphaerales bacterium]MCI0674147.1 hypothetical protein [Phycisphaerales bacterium]
MFARKPGLSEVVGPGRFAVPAQVEGVDDVAFGGQESGEPVVSSAVLANAVSDLYHCAGANSARGEPLADEYRGLVNLRGRFRFKDTAGMIQFFHSPTEPLAGLVQDLWACADAPSRDVGHSRERILPSGTIELVINLCDNELRIYDPAHSEHCRRLSGAVVSGTYRSVFVIDPKQHASIMGVHFKPGGASGLLGVPASELTDTHVDLEALWGASAAFVNDCAPLPRRTSASFSWSDIC